MKFVSNPTWRHALPAFLAAFLAAYPAAVQASFGGAPCQNAMCFFQYLGILFGVFVGIPATALLFLIANLIARHPLRSPLRQALLGIVSGALAYEVAALLASLTYGYLRGSGVYDTGYPVLAVLASSIAAFLFLSVRYARSSPAPAQE